MRIAIVDDEPLARARLRGLLQALGRDEIVGEAASGLEALALVSSTDPDVVLLDIRLPGMDGLALCRSIKAEASLRRTKVVLLSARGQPADRKAGEAAGADLYMAKPYGPLDLLAAVKRMVN